MKHEHVNEIKAIVIFAVSVILLASFVSFVPEDLSWYTSHPNIPAKNLIRVVGAYAAGGMFFIFGYGAYASVLFLLFWSWNKFLSRHLNLSFAKFVSFLVLFCTVSALFSLLGPQISTLKFQRAGIVGLMLSDFLVKYCGHTGAFVILATFTTLTMIIIGEFLVSPLIFKLMEITKAFLNSLPQKQVKAKGPAVAANRFSPRMGAQIEKETKEMLKEKLKREPISSVSEPKLLISQPKPVVKPQIHITTPEKKEEAPVVEAKPKREGTYQFPNLDLLDDVPVISSNRLESDLVIGARILEETLADFNVIVRVADIERGPVITRYELEPAPGVKVQSITTLSDDIALAMKAPSVRIVAPIPGKNRVGIEVPNGGIASVFLKEVLATSEFRTSNSKLVLALGKDIAGMPIVADLAEMPHLLIAGTTGSGKTVCVNSIIMSMLYHASPDEVKFLN